MLLRRCIYEKRKKETGNCQAFGACRSKKRTTCGGVCSLDHVECMQNGAFFYVMCILAALQVYDPIVQLFVLIISMARTNQCVRRISDLKKEEGLAVREPVQTTDGSDIAFENVRFSYPFPRSVWCSRMFTCSMTQ